MKKIFRSRFIFFLLGAFVMFILDIIFHFNNSIEKGVDRELNKAQRKIEDIFK